MSGRFHFETMAEVQDAKRRRTDKMKVAIVGRYYNNGTCGDIIISPSLQWFDWKELGCGEYLGYS